MLHSFIQRVLLLVENLIFTLRATSVEGLSPFQFLLCPVSATQSLVQIQIFFSSRCGVWWPEFRVPRTWKINYHQFI